MIPDSSLTGFIAIIFVLFIIYVIMKNRHEKIKRRKDNRSIFRRNRD